MTWPEEETVAAAAAVPPEHHFMAFLRILIVEETNHRFTENDLAAEGWLGDGGAAPRRAADEENWRTVDRRRQMEGGGGGEERRGEAVEERTELSQSVNGSETADERGEEKELNRKEIIKAVEVVEKDSLAIAESFTDLFSSLRSALSEVKATISSVDHMHCFGDATGRLQESVLDAATKGNRYINSCLRLNEELKGIETLAAQLKFLRRNVDALDSAVNKLIRLP
ncbi:hypothetical protein LINPERHAP1_LOCUS14281 [Linum perenne]